MRKALPARCRFGATPRQGVYARVEETDRVGGRRGGNFCHASRQRGRPQGGREPRWSSASGWPRQGLWREAIYRWERAVELDPTYAAAFNNLAIAYEQAGQLDKAKQAYEKAAELDPKNTSIKQNIDLFKEINDRANRQTPR